MPNYLEAAREMIARAKEDPFTSRYYGIPSKPTVQRAIYIGAAANALHGAYNDLWWEAWREKDWSRADFLSSRCVALQNIFASACSRESIRRISPNRRLP